MKRNDFLEIKNLEVKQLAGKAGDLRKELAKLQMEKDKKDLKQMMKKRKDLAQILTVLRQKQLLAEYALISGDKKETA